jgi:peptide/nickel transport system substrate-binding protein
MHEQDLRERIAAVKAGRVSRRTFAHRMIGLGLTVPFASQLLAHAGLAQSPAPIDYKPTRAGGGGALRTLFWQAPTSLNPHFAVGAKDAEGAGIFTSRWRPGSPTGTWFRYLLPRFRTSRTAGLPLTACRLSGS